eukprot:gene7458-9164_t
MEVPLFYSETTSSQMMVDSSSSVEINKKKSNEIMNNTLEDYTFDEYFEIKESIKVIKEYGFKKVALQIPDHLLWASSQITTTIQQEIQQDDFKVFILGDTSYGSCCVDEVTSSHLRADFIIHYGHSCLSPSSKIPVQYVFGKKKFDFYRYYINDKKLLKETLPRNNSLMRRYHISEKCKDSSIIGIVVATLAVVGRLNVPKLANFSEIDIFVIVACPENTIIDSKDFFKPIATPFELNLALRGKQWTGEYITDFGRIFPTLIENLDKSDSAPKPEDHVTDDQGNELHFSLVTGRLMSSNNNNNNDISNKSNSGGEMIPVNDSMKQLSVSEDFFKGRSYKGLDVRLGETPVTNVVIGQSGIPKNYDNDIKNLNQ